MMLPEMLAMVLAAGAAPPQTGFEAYPVRSENGHRCGTARTKALIGRKRSPAVEAEASRLSGAAIVRWVAMGAMVTMDYRPDRLNLRLDRRGRILSANCG
jgi:hypothetical protein